jgi:hypothetical protein
VRINAQLIDGETGDAHLWADRFEDDIADLFKLQDEVVALSGASDMSGLGSTWFVRFLNRGITCCRRFGWRVYWTRSHRIVRGD